MAAGKIEAVSAILPPVELVRAMRKGHGRSALARTLYGYRMSIPEITEALGWRRDQVVQAIQRPAKARR